jgi:hypothetical protein|tara:strand:+ start:234 stop:704 length:471 start_codon:yes stop_codon:yes gene_type:complete
MNWDAIGAIGEIIGAFAVVISLIYLATQIRNQNREAKISSVHEITEAFRLAITSFQDAQRAEVYTRALNNYEGLSDAEKLQFISMVQGVLRVWEEAFYQYSEKRLDERVWNAWSAQYKDWLSSPGFQKVWEIRKHTYSAEFQLIVDSIEVGQYKLE